MERQGWILRNNQMVGEQLPLGCSVLVTMD